MEKFTTLLVSTIVLTLFVLPVNAHEPEMLKRDIVFWLTGATDTPECVLKRFDLKTISANDLEQLHRSLSSPMFSVGKETDKIGNVFDECKEEQKKKEQLALTQKLNEDIKNLLITNNGVMKTCYKDDPTYLSMKGNEISGFVYDRLSHYGDITGLKIEYNVVSVFAKCLVGMEEGTYDILTWATRKSEREEYMDYYHPKSSDKFGIYISKKSPFAKFADEIQQSVDMGLKY